MLSSRSRTAVQEWVFTIAVTAISRLLILRDCVLKRVQLHDLHDDDRVRFIPQKIKSGTNSVDALFAVPAQNEIKAGILICHGIGETLAHWHGVQHLLCTKGVASLVFSYSGYEGSSGRVSAVQCERDAVEAFAALQQLLPNRPITILGYSLGSGVAAAIAPQVNAKQLILCATYTSLREASRRMSVPRYLTYLLPAIWDNKAAIANSNLPVQILHGSEDHLFPEAMAHAIAAQNSNCTLTIVPGVTHNGPIYTPELSYWSEVINRVTAIDF